MACDWLWLGCGRYSRFKTGTHSSQGQAEPEPGSEAALGTGAALRNPLCLSWVSGGLTQWHYSEFLGDSLTQGGLAAALNVQL